MNYTVMLSSLVLLLTAESCRSIKGDNFYLPRHGNLSFTSDGRIIFVEPVHPKSLPIKNKKNLLHDFDLDLDPDVDGSGSDDLHMVDHQYMLGNGSTEARTKCFIYPEEQGIPQKLELLLKEKNKLIHFDVSFLNYSYNPLVENMTVVYKGNKWTRVSSMKGQTLLSLAFNYGVLSLMTLSFGVTHMEIKLRDEPFGCFEELTEQEKMGIVMEKMMRDFKDTKVLSLSEEESICHQVLQSSNGHAFFTHHCCHAQSDGKTMTCLVNKKNVWIRILDILLIVVKFVVLCFGPLLAPSGVFTKALDAIRFVVKLKEPMTKTICIVRGMDKSKVKAKHVINLCEAKHFVKCREQISELPHDVIIPVKIHKFEIAVDYSKLLVENKVPVGLVRSISHAIFSCGLQELDPFKACCKENMFSYLKEMQPLPWIVFWNGIGKFLLVLLIPSLFYVRLFFFYNFENPEIVYRTAIAEQNNLSLSPHDFKMMQYLLPTHPLCITIYCIYGITVVILAYVGLTGDMKRFQRIIYNSFNDLNNLSWLKVSELVCAKVIWPFSRFGVVGCLLAPFFWMFIMPWIFLIYFLYCLPLIFLTYRMILYSMRVLNKAKMKRKNFDRQRLPLPQPLAKGLEKGAKTFEEEFLLHQLVPDQDGGVIDRDRPTTSSMRRVSIRCVAVFLLILSVYGVSILATECVGFVAEVLTFTLMGIIVNASSVLKYLTMLLLVVMYSYDCFDNVYKKYVKLNKSLFTDVKGRMTKQVEEVTSLPAHLQENTGFKACENSEQADYESPDDISTENQMHWDLNDVILFIDNQDMPRIPQTLFQQVCQIRVAGSPGPVFRSMITAAKKFMFIIFFLIFIFIVVLSFGSLYKVSSANQTLAALAGGFVPFIMRNFMQPSTPELEIGTVSFRSKLDEIIQNFSQQWPMYDFPFEVDVDTGEDCEGITEGDGCDKSTQTINTISTFGKTDSESQLIQTPDIMTSTGLANLSPKSPINAQHFTFDISNTAHPNIEDGQNGTVVKLDSPIPVLEPFKNFPSALHQEVDVILLLPEAGETTWCRVWSRMSLYDQDAIGAVVEEEGTDDELNNNNNSPNIV